MSNRNRVRLAVGFIVVGLILVLSLIGSGQTLLSLLPEQLRPTLASNMTVIALLFFTGAIWLLWDVASKAAALEEAASEAIRIAQEERDILADRVTASEAKLVAAIDRGALDWSPAFERLLEDLTGRMNGQYQRKEMELEAAFVSYKRQLRHGAPDFPGPGETT